MRKSALKRQQMKINTNNLLIMKTLFLPLTPCVLKAAAMLLILLSATSSCGEKEEATEVPFTEYSLAETSCWWSNLDIKEIIIINSNAELEKYITCTEGTFPEVDFSKNTLLIAHGGATNGVGKITPSFYQNSAYKYTLNVSIVLGITMVAEGWSITILVPKISDNAEINLNVQLIKPS
jgi:hypothetical protein